MIDFVMEYIIPIIVIILSIFLFVLCVTAIPHLINGDAYPKKIEICDCNKEE